MEVSSVQTLIGNIARSLVDKSGDVSVTAAELGGNQVLELRVASSDLGRVIGRQGRTARSLRTIVAAAATKQNSRVTLEIVE